MNTGLSPVTPIELMQLLDLMRRCGVVMLPDTSATRRIKSVSRAEAAELLGCSVSWIRGHEEEFPHTYSLGTDPRYLLSDLEAFVARHRIQVASFPASVPTQQAA